MLAGVVRAAFRSVSPETAVPAAVALTVVAFACGSSSVGWLDRIGKDLRWAVLVVLVLAAAVLFALRVAWSRARPFVLAGWLLALAVVSTSWSVDPRLTFERAGSLGLLFVAAFLIATTAASLALVERVLAAILTGAAAVGVLGLVVLVVDRGAALEHGSTGVPTRYRCLGEDANTAALLFAVVLPLAAWGIVRGGARRTRILSAAAFLLLDGSIAASLSRGAMAGAFAGVLVVVLAAARDWPSRLWFAAAAVALLAITFGVSTIPKPLSTNPPPAAAPSQPTPKPGYLDANEDFPLSDDIGRPLPNQGETLPPRQNFGSSGRTEAWRGALHQAAQRPVAGHGFGTEARVFVDRYHLFAGAYPEDSYIGFLLQLGIGGLVSFLALMAVWLARGARAYGRLGERDRLALVASSGIVVAGLVCAVVQSYLASVGNIATVSFWIGAFVLAALGDPWSVWPSRPPIG
jgi:O-Antigen ligase